MSSFEILPFAPELAPEFARINRAWIEAWFQLEPADEEVLRDPGQIVKEGGAILFARRGGRIVGTVALVRLSDGIFEVAKMGVDADQRGCGIGDALLSAAIAEARRRHARVLKIETNARLEAALRLYHRHGFVPEPGARSAHGFARANVFLQRELRDASDGEVAARA